MVGKRESSQQTDMSVSSPSHREASFMIKDPRKIVGSDQRRLSNIAQSGRLVLSSVDIPKDQTNPARSSEYSYPKKVQARAPTIPPSRPLRSIRQSADLRLRPRRAIIYSGGWRHSGVLQRKLTEAGAWLGVR